MVQNEQIVLLLQKLKEMKSNVYLIMYDYNIETKQVEDDDEAKESEGEYGKDLVKNLSESGISLYGLYTTPNMETWVRRLDDQSMTYKITYKEDLSDVQKGNDFSNWKSEVDKVDKQESEMLMKKLKCYFILEANYKR